MDKFQDVSIVYLILIEIIILIIIYLMILYEKNREIWLFENNENFEFENKIRFWRLYIIPTAVFIILYIRNF